MATSIGNLIATVGLQLGDLDRDIRNATGKLTKFAGKLDALGKDISLKLSAPLAAFGAVSVSAFSDFEKGLAEVQTIIQAPADELDALGKGARQLSKDLGLDLTDTVKGLYEALSANIPKENALAFLATAAKAGIAGVTTTKTAVDGLTTAINAWKIPVEQANEVADKFFIAIRNGKVNFEQLSQSLGTIAPTAASFGVSLDDVLAGLATLTKQGVKPAQAFTQMESAITALAKPNKEMAGLLGSLGYESGSAMIKAKGLVGSLDLLRTAAGSLDTLTAALGSIEALGAATGLTGDNLESFNKDLEAVKTSIGETEKAFKTMAETTSTAFDKLKAKIKDLEVSIGQLLTPAVTRAVDKVAEWVDAFGRLSPETQAMIVDVGLFVVVLGPLLTVIGKVIGGIAMLANWVRLFGTFLVGLIPSVATVVVWFGRLAALWGGVTTVAFNLVAGLKLIATAIFSIPTAVVAAGLALGYVASQFEFVQEVSARFNDGLYICFDAIKNFGEGLITFLVSPIATAKSWIDSLMRSFLEFIRVIDSADARLRNAQAGEGSITRARRLGLNGLADSMTDDIRGARATGGPVAAGSAYLVGEHGPELFTPGTNGRIVNHRDTAAALGGGSGPTIHLHLTAGVSSEVRAEVTAMLPALTKAVSRGLVGMKDTATPMGRALRA